MSARQGTALCNHLLNLRPVRVQLHSFVRGMRDTVRAHRRGDAEAQAAVAKGVRGSEHLKEFLIKDYSGIKSGRAAVHATSSSSARVRCFVSRSRTGGRKPCSAPTSHFTAFLLGTGASSPMSQGA